MRKIFAAVSVALSLLVADLAVTAAPARAELSIDSLLTEVIVGFEPGFLPNLHVGDLLDGLPILDRSEPGAFLVLKVPNIDVVHQAFSRIPGVRYIEKNAQMKALDLPTDPRYNQQYGPAMMGFPAAWDAVGFGSSDVKVAIIDSGVLGTHEDLVGGRVLAGRDFISNDDNPDDTCGHGTHVAGIVGATANNNAGVVGMSQSSIIPLKALAKSTGLFSSGSCSGSNAQIANAIYRAISDGADIISMSIGGGASSAIQTAVSDAWNAGIILVAAAGNDGSTNGIDYPGAYPNVIAVGALDASGTRASYSDRGTQLDIMAPGSAVWSTYTGSNTSYASLSGTSMATPAVSGALALALSCNPSLTQTELVNALFATAQPIAGQTGWNSTYGNGLARADALVNAVCNVTPPEPAPPVASFTLSQSGASGSVVNVTSTSTDPNGLNTLSYDWNWGDGTAHATTKSASHTYAVPAPGNSATYTVELTVNDGDFPAVKTSKQVTVSTPSTPPPPSDGVVVVENGQTTTLSMSSSAADQYRKIYVPPGKTNLTVQMTGPAYSCGFFCSIDNDLYTRLGAKPTNSIYACRPYVRGSNETCTTSNPQSGWWYLRVRRVSGTSQVTLKATFS